jgi:tellurite resistance-related uncharacterized protein
MAKSEAALAGSNTDAARPNSGPRTGHLPANRTDLPVTAHETSTDGTRQTSPEAGGVLPEDAAAYKQSPVFDQDTLPVALRRHHQTKQGVWGVIRILEGRLAYTTFAPDCERILDPDSPAVVQPGEPHMVRPIGTVRFLIEFYRTAPSTVSR